MNDICREPNADDDGNHQVGLLERYGELMPGQAIRALLHFGSEQSFRRAAAKQTLPVTVFKVPGRPGWFARTRDVWQWLESVAVPSSPNTPNPMRKEKKP